jgi:hypothetical protein
LNCDPLQYNTVETIPSYATSSKIGLWAKSGFSCVCVCVLWVVCVEVEVEVEIGEVSGLEGSFHFHA